MFKKGDKVIVIKTEFSDEEWKPMGKIYFSFALGDELTVLEQSYHHEGVSFKEDSREFWYPPTGFKLKTEIEYKNQINMQELMLDVLEKTYNNKMLRQKTIPLFMSNPGVGKSTIIKKFAESKGVKMVKITLSQRMPNEVVGMLMPDIKTGKMVAFNSLELSNLKAGDIIFFDEVFNGTLKQTLDAALNFFEDRVFPNGEPCPDVMIVAASNHQGLINLTPQIKERFIMYDLKRDNEGFAKYLKEKYFMPKSIAANLNTLINKEKFDSAIWNYNSDRSIEKAIMQIGCNLKSPYDDLLIPIFKEKIPFKSNGEPTEVEDEKIEYLEFLRMYIQKQNKITDNSNNVSKNNIKKSRVASYLFS